MSVKFQFVPTSGALSGLSFEKQVEQAFTELGDQIDNIEQEANDATGIANNALAVAQDALASAQTANNTAQEADATAREALAVAQNAEAAITAAQTRADEAFNLATTASSKADNAQVSADNAQASSTAAQTSANAAQVSADNATALANSAIEVANNANSIYTATDGVIDLNAIDLFTVAQKLYVKNGSSLNFPSGATFPAYVTVCTTSLLESTTQIVWSELAPDTIYVRSTLSITLPTDPADTIVATWGTWKAIGGNGGAILGEIRLLPFRASELPTGWYFCNGDNYALTSAQGVALNALSGNFKADWGVTVSGSNISLPNLFYSDGRGYFLRAVSTLRQTGSVEGDAFQGHGHRVAAHASADGFSALAYRATSYATNDTLVTAPVNLSGYGSARVDTETHGLNIGMTPAIYLGV